MFTIGPKDSLDRIFDVRNGQQPPEEEHQCCKCKCNKEDEIARKLDEHNKAVEAFEKSDINHIMETYEKFGCETFIDDYAAYDIFHPNGMRTLDKSVNSLIDPLEYNDTDMPNVSVAAVIGFPNIPYRDGKYPVMVPAEVILTEDGIYTHGSNPADKIAFLGKLNAPALISTPMSDHIDGVLVPCEDDGSITDRNAAVSIMMIESLRSGRRCIIDDQMIDTINGLDNGDNHNQEVMPYSPY